MQMLNKIGEMLVKIICYWKGWGGSFDWTDIVLRLLLTIQLDNDLFIDTYTV